MDGVLADVSESYHAAIIDTCHYFGVNPSSTSRDDIDLIKREGNFNNDWILTQELIRRKTGLHVSTDLVT